MVPSIPSTAPHNSSKPFCISHNSFSILSTKGDSDFDSDPDPDTDTDAVNSILLTYKMLVTHPQSIYRGDLTPDGHRHGFGTMHYKIEPWYDDIYIGHWNQDKFIYIQYYLYQSCGSYVGNWLHGDLSDKEQRNTSSGTICYDYFSNDNLNIYGLIKTVKGEIDTGG